MLSNIEKNDYDIPCKASEFAEGFRALDALVLRTGKKLLTLEIQNYASGHGLILAEKNPIRDNNGNIIGFYHPLVDVTNVSLFKSYVWLHHFDSRCLGEQFKPASYLLSEEYGPLNLTKKQESVLFFLIRGKSAKEIAKILSISPRTVECYLDAIKDKMNCHYKSEVIEKALAENFLYYIPRDLQKINFSEIIN